MTIADQLTTLNSTKIGIKNAIEAQGVTVGAVPFADYPAKIALIEGGGAPAPEPEAWVRPTDWLAMPAIEATDVRFDGLVAVEEFEELNYVALTFDQAYTVDWGDGSALEDVAANTTVVHQFRWADVDPITLTSRGYRQALVSVVPQSTAFTQGNTIQRGTLAVSGSYAPRWLDIQLALNNNGSFFKVGSGNGSEIKARLLERFRWLGLNSFVNMTEAFRECHSLQEVELYTAATTNMTSMFRDCASLKSVPLFDTSLVTNMTDMFEGCSDLPSVPLFDTSSVTTMDVMFFGCSSLQAVPLFDTSSVTNMAQMFYNCSSLQAVPLFDTSLVTAMNNMFFGCSSLQSVPLFNTINVTNMSNMFQNCLRLQSVPLFDTSSVMFMLAMFQGCLNLSTIPEFNLTAVTNIGTAVSSAAFRQLNSIKTIKLEFAGRPLNLTGIFQNNAALRELDLGDLSGINNFGGTGGSRWTLSCSGLQRIQGTGYNVLFSVGFSSLGPDALVEIFEGLNDRTGLSSLSVTITGNWGAALLTQAQRDIALNKNWTIVG